LRHFAGFGGAFYFKGKPAAFPSGRRGNFFAQYLNSWVLGFFMPWHFALIAHDSFFCL
jgi:hypothetical protein